MEHVLEIVPDCVRCGHREASHMGEASATRLCYAYGGRGADPWGPPVCECPGYEPDPESGEVRS